jgi:hypothetical protein
MEEELSLLSGIVLISSKPTTSAPLDEIKTIPEYTLTLTG